jgi:CotS family spore coat protein
MVQKSVERNYNIHIEYIEKIKNVYKINTQYGNFCLKVINYDIGHFLFIISAMEHLQMTGFKSVPKIIKTKYGTKYIELENKFAYLTLWIDSRIADYNDKSDIYIAALKLGQLHNKSLGFQLTEKMNPRLGWFKWIETFNTRKNEILDFKNRILKKDKRTEFDNRYIKKIDDEIEKCKYSIRNIVSSNYLEKMKVEVLKNGFCHHDYANHNILISSDRQVNIIDFDYCILDTHLHDLASLLIRTMKHGKWSIRMAEFILDTYSSENTVYQDDLSVMAGFMEFPQDYWQIGIQYYWEEKPWGQDVFLKKLQKIFEDEEQKQQFIEEFRRKKYN